MFYVAIIVAGLALGFGASLMVKAVTGGYAYSNDLENKPVIRKACIYCNSRIDRNYSKNLCPNCRKPIE
ncbi:hypothetical protein EJF36_03420 [Bacillus sp. HMF5848]|uniref:hypothetical protein n=1 Tax=Bacillus sp. HMF5848 TaxID=2495421 RepID=UPI000F79AA21|nr:hypothetical protein [Bacillus sp. HMF5848]RSK26023.1 hypothetical protein EJF36_03420 [Bacillus sp. HMF5848]